MTFVEKVRHNKMQINRLRFERDDGGAAGILQEVRKCLIIISSISTTWLFVPGTALVLVLTMYGKNKWMTD